MGHPALRGTLTCRAGRDPDERVRQRGSRHRARGPLRHDDAGARPGPDLRRVPGPAPGDDAGNVEPGVDARPPPAVASCAARTPGAVRDDVGRAHGPLRAHGRSPRPRARRPAGSTTCTSRPTPATARSRCGSSSVATSTRNLRMPRRSSGVPWRSCTSRPASRTTCSRRGPRRVLAPRARSGSGVERREVLSEDPQRRFLDAPLVLGSGLAAFLDEHPVALGG